jgi:hypothetical protein
MPVQHRNLHLVPSKHLIIPTLRRGMLRQKLYRKVEIAFHPRPYSIPQSQVIVKINCK